SASTRIKSARIVQLSQPAMRSQDTEREPVPGARDAERPLPDARRTVARRSEGQQECPQARRLYSRSNHQAARDCEAVAGGEGCFERGELNWSSEIDRHPMRCRDARKPRCNRVTPYL